MGKKEVSILRQERCIQQKIVSCAGCSVLEIARQNSRENASSTTEIAQEVQKDYCPDGVQMQTRHLRKEKMISMGQVQR